jgi:hypothetical protein
LQKQKSLPEILQDWRVQAEPREGVPAQPVDATRYNQLS